MTRPHVLRPPMVLLVAAMVAFLTPLAYASPADPTWIVGTYDAGDSDAATLLLESMFGTPADWSERALVLTLALAGLNLASPARVHVAHQPPAFEGRGPPTV